MDSKKIVNANLNRIEAIPSSCNVLKREFPQGFAFRTTEELRGIFHDKLEVQWPGWFVKRFDSRRSAGLVSAYVYNHSGGVMHLELQMPGEILQIVLPEGSR